MTDAVDPAPACGTVLASLRQARDVLDELLAGDAAQRLGAISSAVAACLRAGQKVLACGNGGSACDAMHFAEELTGRFRADRPALAALACTDPGHITCTANDYGYDEVFARWVKALGRPGDVLIALSTSGNSPSVVRAVRAAAERGLVTVALLGRGGGALRGVCTHELIVPGDVADRVQELHMLALHAVIEAVEHELFAGGGRTSPPPRAGVRPAASPAAPAGP